MTREDNITKIAEFLSHMQPYDVQRTFSYLPIDQYPPEAWSYIGASVIFGLVLLIIGYLAFRKRVSSIVENPTLFGDLSAKDNLEYFRIQRGIADKEIIDNLLAKNLELECIAQRYS